MTVVCILLILGAAVMPVRSGIALLREQRRLAAAGVLLLTVCATAALLTLLALNRLV